MTFDPAGVYLLDTASIDPFGHLETGTIGSPLSDQKLSRALGATAGMTFYNGALYVADGGGDTNLYTLNPTSGVLILVGSLGLTNGLSGLAATPVPEPGTAAFLGIALLALRRSRVRDGRGMGAGE
jgi:hypothetical protein